MLFTYRALDNNKNLIKGKIEADNEEQAKNYLKAQGLFIIELKSTEQSFSILGFISNRVSFNDIVNFTRQMAIMLNAGLTLVDCFYILKKQIAKDALLKLIDDLEKEVKAGQPLSFALKKHSQLFPNIYIALVQSGEASGKLSEILLKLADNLEKEREFRGKITGALIYPAILIVGMIGVMFITVTFVIPRLLDLFKDFNVELPFTTKLLMIISSFSAKFWPIIIALVFGLVILLNRFLKTEKGKALFDRLILKIPVINNVIRISTLVDATRTMAILIGAGVSLLDTLEIVVGTTSNSIYQQAFKNIIRKVGKGISLGTAMQQEEIFPPILVQMTMVGEQTGKLDETLGRISNYFEMESTMAVKAMTTLIEPTILIFLGLGVGILVTSVITPIYQLTSSFK